MPYSRELASTRGRTLPWVTGLLGFLLTPALAAAQNCDSAPASWGNTSAYEAWCRACGGSVRGSGPRIQCDQGPSWGRKGSGAPSATSAYGAVGQAAYQLGYAFGQWLAGSDPEEELKKRQMLDELRRRREAAEHQHRAEEARRLAEMHDRLASRLKLGGSGKPQVETSSHGVKLKLGEHGNAGVEGLPGMYLEGGENRPYGIPGLPGIYTGGPAAPSPQTAPKLQLKMGETTSAPGPQPAPAGPGDARPPVLDPRTMTPEQLADEAERFGALPAEEQQRLMNGGAQEAPARRLEPQRGDP